jgi:hypothetical protein
MPSSLPWMRTFVPKSKQAPSTTAVDAQLLSLSSLPWTRTRERGLGHEEQAGATREVPWGAAQL